MLRLGSVALEVGETSDRKRNTRLENIGGQPGRTLDNLLEQNERRIVGDGRLDRVRGAVARLGSDRGVGVHKLDEAAGRKLKRRRLAGRKSAQKIPPKIRASDRRRRRGRGCGKERRR